MVTVRLEQALGDLGASALMVAGVCGDYAGYFTTPKEYEAQHYEGASTLWGRASGDWLVEQARRLAKAPPPPLAPEAHFEVEPLSLALPGDPDPPPSLPAGHLDPHPSLSAEHGALVGRFHALPSVLPPFGPDPWILFEEEHDGAWAPLLCDGLRVTDQAYLMPIDRDVEGGVARWTFRFDPPAALAGRHVRFVLAPPEFDPEGAGATSNAAWIPG
jgi:neutral ceramidase